MKKKIDNKNGLLVNRTHSNTAGINVCRVITAVGIFGFSSLATIHFVCCNELCDVAKIYGVRLEICILNSSEGDNCGESLDEQNYITMNRITLP